jgi:dipeptidyl aminopeptidase/acylaminoacyl peptidase
MKLVACLLLPVLVSGVLHALGEDAGYRLPPPEVVALLDAVETPRAVESPDGRWILLLEQSANPSIADISRPWVGLAGSRIDPATNAPWRESYYRGVIIREVSSRVDRRMAFPAGARIADVSWSHTSRRFAVTIATDSGLELWVGEVENTQLRKVANHLNAMFGDAFSWTPDGDGILAKIVPDDRGAAPLRPPVPKGPNVQETAGTKSPVRTFQDLLQTPSDEQLFEHYGLAQVALIDIATANTTPIGKPGLRAQVSLSPNGEHLLVSTIQRRFSYLLPAARFPRITEVWSKNGTVERVIADIPLGENIPIEGVPTGPRNIEWQATAPANVVWVEALDGGDPKRKVEWRDRWMRLAAPFEVPKSVEPVELLRLPQRATGLFWMADQNQVLAREYDRDRRWIRLLLFRLSDSSNPSAIEDRSINDRYGDPGNVLQRITENGHWIVRQDGDWIYRAGTGGTPEGDRPFLDRYQVATAKTERLWQCESGEFEQVVAVAASSAGALPTIFTRRESPAEPPNLRVRDLATGTVTALTDFPDPQPQLRGVHQELVKYKRPDGVELSATLYLPKGHVPGTKLPLIVWAYPREYNDPGTAGQVSGSPSRFVRLRGASHLVLLTQGYAIMDAATMPVVGDPETMNDTFLDQIVASAKAAIDKAVEMGVADRDRVGVGGHSYGAFMTANLLAHSDLFRAGLARSGAYNRTLTPFGFQSERRTIWEAPAAYTKLSPFFFAHQIREPILFVHGEKDSNAGTFPMQSERMYQAVKGNGGTARLVMLPEENHAYRARESVLHVAAETIEWFDRYVKNAPASQTSGSTGIESSH